MGKDSEVREEKQSSQKRLKGKSTVYVSVENKVLAKELLPNQSYDEIFHIGLEAIQDNLKLKERLSLGQLLDKPDLKEMGYREDFVSMLYWNETCKGKEAIIMDKEVADQLPIYRRYKTGYKYIPDPAFLDYHFQKLMLKVSLRELSEKEAKRMLESLIIVQGMKDGVLEQLRDKAESYITKRSSQQIRIVKMKTTKKINAVEREGENKLHGYEETIWEQQERIKDLTERLERTVKQRREWKEKAQNAETERTKELEGERNHYKANAFNLNQQLRDFQNRAPEVVERTVEKEVIKEIPKEVIIEKNLNQELVQLIRTSYECSGGDPKEFQRYYRETVEPYLMKYLI